MPIMKKPDLENIVALREGKYLLVRDYKSLELHLDIEKMEIQKRRIANTDYSYEDIVPLKLYPLLKRRIKKAYLLCFYPDIYGVDKLSLGKFCINWKDADTEDSILMISINEYKNALEWVKDGSFYSVLDLKEELNNPVVHVVSDIGERRRNYLIQKKKRRINKIKKFRKKHFIVRFFLVLFGKI